MLPDSGDENGVILSQHEAGTALKGMSFGRFEKLALSEADGFHRETIEEIQREDLTITDASTEVTNLSGDSWIELLKWATRCILCLSDGNVSEWIGSRAMNMCIHHRRVQN